MACPCCAPACCFSAAHAQALPSITVTYTHTRLASSTMMLNRFGSMSPLLDGIRASSGPEPFTSLTHSVTLADFANGPLLNPCATRNLSGVAPRPVVNNNASPPVLFYFDDTYFGTIRTSAPGPGVCNLLFEMPAPPLAQGALSAVGINALVSSTNASWSYSPSQDYYEFEYYWHNYTLLDSQASPPCVFCCDYINAFPAGRQAWYDVTVASTPRAIDCFAYNGHSIFIRIQVDL